MKGGFSYTLALIFMAVSEKSKVVPVLFSENLALVATESSLF